MPKPREPLKKPPMKRKIQRAKKTPAKLIYLRNGICTDGRHIYRFGRWGASLSLYRVGRGLLTKREKLKPIATCTLYDASQSVVGRKRGDFLKGSLKDTVVKIGGLTSDLNAPPLSYDAPPKAKRGRGIMPAYISYLREEGAKVIRGLPAQKKELIAYYESSDSKRKQQAKRNSGNSSFRCAHGKSFPTCGGKSWFA